MYTHTHIEERKRVLQGKLLRSEWWQKDIGCSSDSLRAQTVLTGKISVVSQQHCSSENDIFLNVPLSLRYEGNCRGVKCRTTSRVKKSFHFSASELTWEWKQLFAVFICALSPHLCCYLNLRIFIYKHADTAGKNLPCRFHACACPSEDLFS